MQHMQLTLIKNICILHQYKTKIFTTYINKKYLNILHIQVKFVLRTITQNIFIKMRYFFIEQIV